MYLLVADADLEEIKVLPPEPREPTAGGTFSLTCEAKYSHHYIALTWDCAGSLGIEDCSQVSTG